jgi:ATP-dependent DNA helicase RecG
LKTAAKTGSEKSSETVSAEMSGKMSGKVSGKMSGKVLQLLLQNPQLSIPELAAAMGKTTRTVERIIRLLREEGHLKRIGPAKGGYWQVITNDED